MNIFKILFILVTFTLVFQSCKTDEGCPDGISGTLVELNLDGCSWVIELEDNKKIIPVNFDSFGIEKENDIKLLITYSQLNDVAGICMAGKMVELSCVQKVK